MPQKKKENDTITDKQSEWQRRAGQGTPDAGSTCGHYREQHSGPDTHASSGSSDLSGSVISHKMSVWEYTISKVPSKFKII